MILELVRSPREGIGYVLQYSCASLVALRVKNLPAMWETSVQSLLGKTPGGRHGNPLKYSCLENFHGQRSLAGYSPWDPEELDMSEQISTQQHIPE